MAICSLLHYSSVVTKGTCLQLVAASYAFGEATSPLQTMNVFALPFCGPNQVTHYFCDIPFLLHLECDYIVAARGVLCIHSALAPCACCSHPHHLQLGLGCHWEHALSSWEGESPLHMCLPLPSHYQSLWHSGFHIHSASWIH